MNIATWVERNGKIHADRPALSLGSDILLTYRQWALLTRCRASALARRFNKGSRIAIVMNNSPGFFEAIFAIWHAGLVAVPINAKLHPNELAYIIENSGAVLMITDAELAPNCSGLSEILVTGSTEWRKDSAAVEMDLVDALPDDPAWIFYTSGTTGRPKGATLTHRNLLMMSLGYYADIEPVTASHAIVHPAPLSHGSGLYSLPFVAKGANNVVPESGAFDPAEMATLFRAVEHISFFAAPTMIRRLVENSEFSNVDKRNLRTLIYGGAPMHVEDLKRALEVIGNRLVQI
jgi:acyl-CoA synthetase (AMP-forming)/AMP-acid ligase II